MKPWAIILLGVVLLGQPTVGESQFSYFTNNGAITINGYTGTNLNVTIPDTITGLPVVAISSFYSYPGPTIITIPATVTNIATRAFALQNLTSIIVDSGNVWYSSSNGVLFDKPQTTLIEAPGGITGVYSIPTNVVSIGDSAFLNCDDLTNITIPNSVTNFAEFAFSGCALTNVAIGPNVLNIGSYAFLDCQILKAINVDAGNLNYSSTNGILFNKSQSTLIQAPGAIAGAYAIPAGTTSIGTDAFGDCTSLTGITMPDSATNIGSEAFISCNDLTNLVIGANVTSIGEYAFNDCSSLTNIEIPDGVTSIGPGAFEECAALTGVTLGTNVTSIGEDAFYYCSVLTQLLIPNSVTNIGGSALAYCESLTNIVLGNNVAVIGDDALLNCTGLISFAIPASVTSIGNSVFSGCQNLAAITVDPNNAFYSSANGILFDKLQTTLIQVPGGFVGSCAIPASVTSIVVGAMAACVHLTAITVSPQNTYFTATNGVLFDKLQTTLIQFPGAVGGGYTVPSGITQLGGTAFYGCTNLTSINIPSTVTNVGFSSFFDCSRAQIYFQGNAPANASFGLTPVQILQIFIGGSSFNPNAETIYYLPGTTGWGPAFDGEPAYLWIPPYVCTPASNSITINGFTGSGSSIVIPNTIEGLPVTAIANGAFDNTAGLGLTNIILGANVATLGDYAFAACVNLTSITIPDSVTNLGNGTFADCANLTSVYFQGNAPSTGYDVFFEWPGFPFYDNAPTPTTVYYLPGTSGWGTTFAGQPAVLWNPEAQTGGPGIGTSANGFGFNITGPINLTVVVEASTNLSNWQPVQTITLTTGSAYFSDPQWTNYPGRYYRFRSP